MFTDCGFAACAAEMRCFAATTTPDGRRLVIASPYDVGRRGYLLVADVDAGTVKQVCFPDGVPHKPSYGALLASNGCFYMAQDRDLFEFDPPSCRWTFQCRLSPDLSIPLCMTEGPDGTLWTGGYPKCLVASLDLKTRTLRDHGSMDDREMYLASLAVDRQGWVYSGIGTARANLVAYHPATGEKRQLLPDAERCLGTSAEARMASLRWPGRGHGPRPGPAKARRVRRALRHAAQHLRRRAGSAVL
jgi:hypothetical protein